MVFFAHWARGLAVLSLCTTCACGGTASDSREASDEDADGTIPLGDGGDPGAGGVPGAGGGSATASGGSSLGAGGAGSGGLSSAGGAASQGACFDRTCAGACKPVAGADTSCSAEWECHLEVACTDDLAPYCGCDGETFFDSGSCASRAYAHTGPCDNSIAGGVNCDATLVVTLDLPPSCPVGEIPSVIGRTWGPCTPLPTCGCDTPNTQEQCGDGLSYICGQDNRCRDLVH